MSPRLFDEWRSGRRNRRAVATYIAALMTEPSADDVAWLAAAACDGDLDRARWELRYARRALGLVVAQRDSLDDRTPSLVARELADAVQSDRNVAPAMLRIAERQFNDRLTSYRDVLISRSTQSPSARLGRTLLQIAGTSFPQEDLVVRGGEVLSGYVAEANDALRAAFGAPTLLTDRPPAPSA
ncbi:MAG: hypothetical protein ABIT38_03105 [Gemmatimonadaceae bacterium]